MSLPDLPKRLAHSDIVIYSAWQLDICMVIRIQFIYTGSNLLQKLEQSHHWTLFNREEGPFEKKIAARTS